MRILVWVASAALVVAGCGKVSGEDSADGGGGGGGDDGGDGDGDGGGPVDDCEPDEPLACDGTELRVCNPAGDGEVRVTCGLRCDPETLACHDEVDPSNGFAALLDAAETGPAIVIDGGGTVFFDTVTDVAEGVATIGGQTVDVTVVPGDPAVLVLPVASFRVVAGTTLSIQGERAVAIMSWGEVRVPGTLRVVAGRSFEVEEDCWGRPSGGVGANNDIPGPGGGSFGTAGASGGEVTNTAGAEGKAPGEVTGNETLVPLRGGCPGGADGLGGPGHGGGAIQITSRTAIVVPGAIGANGGGGCVSSAGGSGGGVLLEAPSVSVAGGLFANGGGGGCGGFSCGEPATMSTTPAPGDDICDQATGGNGAAGDLQATVGGNVTGTAGATDRAGGGGGGFGRIRVNSLDGAIEGTPVLSPDASVGQVAGR